MARKVIEDDKYYRFYDGNRIGPKIDKEKGRGRVLTHLIENIGTPVSLESIFQVSNWDAPNKKVNKRIQKFIMQINAWSPYTIEKIGRGRKSSYRLTKEQ